MIYAINRKTKEHRITTGAPECPMGHFMSDGDRWEIVVADDEVWIPHDGQECPLPGDAELWVKYRNGGVERGRAESFITRWSNDGTPQSIIAYHPILDAKPEAPEWDGEGDCPPVGSVCLKGCMKVKILAHTTIGSPYDPAVVWQSLDDPMEIDWSVANVFAPIRSEEDRCIDEMIAAAGLDDESYNRAVCRDIHRAGYRKQ